MKEFEYLSLVMGWSMLWYLFASHLSSNVTQNNFKVEKLIFFFFLTISEPELIVSNLKTYLLSFFIVSNILCI